MMPSSMYHKNTSLIVKSHNFIDFDSKHGLIFRAFFVVFFCTPSPVSWCSCSFENYGFPLKRKKRRSGTLGSGQWFRRKKLPRGEPGSVVSVPSHLRPDLIFGGWDYCLLREHPEPDSRMV